MASKPVYMTRLADTRVRRLPPMTPIQEDSAPGTPTKQPPPKSQPPARPQKGDVPEEYRYLVMNRVPAKPQKEPWHPYEVEEVVGHYLKAATLGGNPMEPQPNALCDCCHDINDENRRRKAERHTHPHPRPHFEQDSLKYSSMKYEEPKVQTYSADFGIYRTESPELLSDSAHHDIPEYEATALDRRTIFVTHPAKNSLYSNWGVRNEVETYGHDRKLAEEVVEASSNFIDAMEKLKKISSS